MIRFKSFVSKDLFLKSYTTNRLAEVYRSQQELIKMSNENNLVYFDNFEMFGINTWDDYEQSCKICSLDFAFLYSNNNKIIFFTSNGNIIAEIKDNYIDIFQKTGIFNNVKDIDGLCEMFAAWYRRHFYNIDIVISEEQTLTLNNKTFDLI